MLMISNTSENNSLIRRVPKLFGSTKIVVGWLRIIGRWVERSRQRRALAELEDHFLDDIGVTKSEAAREITRPFWR
jgi:uncharacterized protein YjiS (DUF1127 family)